MIVPIVAAAPHLEFPPPAEPNSPGPFAFADADYLDGLLREAGFDSIEIDPFDTTMNMGSGADIEDSIDFITKIGPLTKLLLEADADTITKVKDSIRAALKPFQTSTGVSLGAAVWLVRARSL